MNSYSSIKELVLDAYISEGSMPSYEKLTSLVRRHFPNSRWQQSHYAYYKSQIKTGKIPLPDQAPADRPDAYDDENDVSAEAEESFEARASLERDVRDYLASHLNELEPGLTLHKNGVEYQTDAGRVDIFALDADQQSVAIETKAGKAGDRALGQLLGYMGCLSCRENTKRQIRGILVAADFASRVIYARKNLPNVKLMKYTLSFTFGQVT
jgi:endonuclease